MVDMEKLVSLCKRRGFIFQNSEIYGGINGFWDYGPVGAELKRRIRDSWWKNMVQDREDVVGIDTAIIAHPQTWLASGHVASFSDPMVDCKKCKKRYRADDIYVVSRQSSVAKSSVISRQSSVTDDQRPTTDDQKADNQRPTTSSCPECGGELTEARQFNLMFQTHVGASEDSKSLAYLRPETCQSIFTQFKNVSAVSRQKIPFGIAQIGKAFRNEITPRNFIFRSREFEQMELEFFCHETESKKWFEYWVNERFEWFLSLGINKKLLRRRPHNEKELAHYAKSCTDIEFEMPFGWAEMEGIANRGNYDLSQHIKTSGKDLSWFNEQTKERFVPSVIETSAGVDRALLAILVDAYREEDVRGETRVVMGFNPLIAPYQVAVFPLSDKLSEPARKLERELRRYFVSDFDNVGSIGKRYRRHDEIGTPFCVTYDFQSEDDHAVTIRDRDSMQQDRVAMDKVTEYLKEKFRQ